MSFLQVRALRKAFVGLVAVNDVDFDVEKGSITALIGPNGAGKTTCFNLIAGAAIRTSGSIHFDDRALFGHSPEQACARGVGRTFQIVRPLAGMTVLDNVVVGALLHQRSVSAARAEAMEVLERVHLGAKADSLASQLALPQRKLLELAKALATKPKLLMLDEVMAGLRPGEADEIASVLKDLNRQGLTIFLIEHVMRVVMAIADKVIVLHHGEKIAEGTASSIVSDPRVIACYFGSRTPTAGGTS